MSTTATMAAKTVNPVLDVVDLTYSVGKRALLEGLSLSLDYGEAVAIMGPSGSGKSTLLSCILGLLRPDKGSILVESVDVTKLRGSSLARCRHDKIGMVFQFGELIPELSPLENVALPALLTRTNHRSAYSRAQSLLDELGVPREGRADQLSGGERQRAAVARALVNDPSLIIADEPTGSLDDKARDQVAELLVGLPRSRKCGVLIVTHDADVAACADRILNLRDGSLSAAAPSEVTAA